MQFAWYLQGTKGPEDQGTRGPGDQRTRGPKDQGNLKLFFPVFFFQGLRFFSRKLGFFSRKLRCFSRKLRFIFPVSSRKVHQSVGSNSTWVPQTSWRESWAICNSFSSAWKIVGEPVDWLWLVSAPERLATTGYMRIYKDIWGYLPNICCVVSQPSPNPQANVRGSDEGKTDEKRVCWYWFWRLW